MTKSMKLPIRDDNSSEDADRIVKWARKIEGVEAHVVFDYLPISDGTESVPGALNGVTVQWSHTEMVIDELDVDGDGDVTEVIARVSTIAVHVKPGGSITRVDEGFVVVNPAITSEGGI